MLCLGLSSYTSFLPKTLQFHALEPVFVLDFGNKVKESMKIVLKLSFVWAPRLDYRALLLVVTSTLSRWICKVAADLPEKPPENNGESSMTIVNEEKRLN